MRKNVTWFKVLLALAVAGMIPACGDGGSDGSGGANGGGAAGGDDAQFVSQSAVPTTMTTGQTASVSLTFRNLGTTTWTGGTGYKLASRSPRDNTTWGLNRVALAGSVAPGAQTTFTFTLTAPATAGSYTFQWSMVLDPGTNVFGDVSTSVTVAVTAAPPPPPPPPGTTDDAQFISQSGVPATMTTGQTAAVSVTFRNSGTTTWTTAGGYKLTSRSPRDNTTWGLNRVALPGSVAPGGQTTLAFTMTAPSTEGTYTFQWSMVIDPGTNVFGEVSTAVSIVVSAPPPPPPPPGTTDDAQFVSQSGVPSSMTTGQTASVSVTFKNAGTSTWTAAGGYKLTSRSPFGNTTWGFNRVNLPGSVSAGQQTTFTFTITAPSSSGSFTFATSMFKEGAASGFGQLSTAVSVTVQPPAGTSDPLDETKVSTYDITLSGSDWNAIVANIQDETWRRCTVVWNGNETYNDVGVRGAYGSFGNYISLSLKFDKFVNGQRFHSIDKLKLYANAADPAAGGPYTTDGTLMKNRIAYHVYRSLGVEAPRIPYCMLSINGGPRRLYGAEERTDREFFQARYGTTVNQAYKWTNYRGTTWDSTRDYEWLGTNVASYCPWPFDMQIDAADQSGSDLINLIDVANNNPGNLASVLDVDNFLRFMAVECVVAEIDGYSWGYDGSGTIVNNHVIYRHPGTGKFIFLKWDADHSYAVDAQYKSIYAHYDEHVLTRPLISQNAANQATYKGYIRQLINGYHGTNAMWSRIDEVKALIDPYVQQDPYRNYGDWLNAVDAMKTRIQQRNGFLNGQVP